jgi:hypothetical protein
MGRTCALAFCALLAACTPMQWVKQDAAGEQVGRDEAECRQAAWREASARYWFHQPLGPVFVPHPAGGGFFAWPTGAMVDPYGHQMLEENRLTQFCMESKGYRLTPAPKQ